MKGLRLCGDSVTGGDERADFDGRSVRFVLLELHRIFTGDRADPLHIRWRAGGVQVDSMLPVPHADVVPPVGED